MNPFYNIWNYDYIQQQAQMQHHFSQVKQVQDTAKALSDFWTAATKSSLLISSRQRQSFVQLSLRILISTTEDNFT